mgnify:FL=1
MCSSDLEQKSDALAVELLFYRFAHDVKQRDLALASLKQIILQGARSPGWDLSKNIERASIDLHPNLSLLVDLAKVISEGAAISSLETYDEWLKA